MKILYDELHEQNLHVPGRWCDSLCSGLVLSDSRRGNMDTTWDTTMGMIHDKAEVRTVREESTHPVSISVEADGQIPQMVLITFQAVTVLLSMTRDTMHQLTDRLTIVAHAWYPGQETGMGEDVQEVRQLIAVCEVFS